MPTYMDMHDIPGVKAKDVAGAHQADLKVQGKYGVDYKQYWVNESEEFKEVKFAPPFVVLKRPPSLPA